MPTSIAIAPSLNQSPLINSGFPIATITMSACLTYLSKSTVFEWQRDTVASCLFKRSDRGSPTILLLPITVTCFPAILGQTV